MGDFAENLLAIVVLINTFHGLDFLLAGVASPCTG